MKNRKHTLPPVFLQHDAIYSLDFTYLFSQMLDMNDLTYYFCNRDRSL
jgi:hypothetical protein